MANLRAALLAEARARHGSILPCATKRSLEECFSTLPDGEQILWFNLPNGSTCILRESALAK